MLEKLYETTAICNLTIALLLIVLRKLLANFKKKKVEKDTEKEKNDEVLSSIEKKIDKNLKKTDKIIKIIETSEKK